MAGEEESMVRGTLSLHTRRAKLSLRASQHINLSSHHFRTAALIARECLDLERLSVAEITDRQRLQDDGLASSTIIAAVCALEAAVNEVRADADAARRGMPVELASHARRIHELWHTIERAPLLNKFDWLLQMGDRAPLERGAEPCQSAADLIVWRNALTHFTAEWDDDAKTSAQFEKRLAGKSPLNPFATGSMFSPYGSLGGGGTRWAVQGAVSYLDVFSASCTCHCTGNNRRLISRGFFHRAVSCVACAVHDGRSCASPLTRFDDNWRAVSGDHASPPRLGYNCACGCVLRTRTTCTEGTVRVKPPEGTRGSLKRNW